MRVRTLLTELRLPRPVEEIFAFSSDAHNLDVLTPPWLHFRILTPYPTTFASGRSSSTRSAGVGFRCSGEPRSRPGSRLIASSTGR